MKRVVPTAFPHDPLVDSTATLGAAIRAARTQSGLRLADVAISLGLSKQTLIDVEFGKPTVAVGTVLRIAEQLGVSILFAPAERRQLAREVLQAAIA